MRKKINL